MKSLCFCPDPCECFPEPKDAFPSRAASWLMMQLLRAQCRSWDLLSVLGCEATDLLDIRPFLIHAHRELMAGDVCCYQIPGCQGTPSSYHHHHQINNISVVQKIGAQTVNRLSKLSLQKQKLAALPPYARL